MKRQLRILYLEDDPYDADLLSRRFARHGFHCDLVVVSDRSAFLQELAPNASSQAPVDLVIADYRVPGFEHLEALKILQQTCPGVPFIFLSGFLGEEMAIEALQNGAVDYILKDRQERLVPAIRRALLEVEARNDRIRAEEALRESEELNRTILNALSSSIAVIDRGGTIIAVNQAWQRLALETPDAPLLHDDVGFNYFQSCEGEALTSIRAVAEGSLPSFTSEYSRGSGEEERWFLLQATPLSGDNGGAVVLQFDITERKRQEEALRQARDTLELRVEERTAEVRHLAAEILRAQEAERQRVARELHDSVSQLLASAKTRVQSLEGLIPTQEKGALQTAVQTRCLLERCIEEVSRISHNLMPSELEDLGLLAAVRSLCVELQEKSSIDLRLEHSGFPEELSQAIELPLFRIIQEALTNAAKHSDAAHVSLQLDRDDSTLEATITDDGRGFDPNQHRNRNSKRGGMGLMNMRERASLIGGVMNISSAPGKGTRIQVRVPMET